MASGSSAEVWASGFSGGVLLNRVRLGRRMDFDTDILVRADWAGMPLVFVPTEVRYPEGGVSHFHYLRDNLWITAMHARLLAGMFPRIPRLVARHFRSDEDGGQ